MQKFKKDFHLALFRVSTKQYIDELYKEGKIYMNHFEGFHDMKGNKGDEWREDPDEGVEGIALIGKTKGQNFSISINGQKISMNDADKWSGQLKTRDDTFKGNIYSMYSIPADIKNPENFRVDERMINSGESCILIHNPYEFLRRVEEKLTELSLDDKLMVDTIEYFNEETYEGEVGIFRKRRKYNFQQEFRLFVRRDENIPLVFYIGSIEDISMIFDSSLLATLELMPAQ